MPHGGDGCGCGGGTPEVAIPTQQQSQANDETGETSPEAGSEVTFSIEELKAMTYYLYSEVPFMKGYLNNELKHFVRGDLLASFIMDPETTKFGLDKITTPEQSFAVVNQLLAATEPRILARVEKAKDSSGQKVLMSGRAVLQPTVKQTYDGLADKKGRYVWLYAGESSWWAQYLPYIILFAILAICMFPLWPIWLKKGVFWASVAFLVVFIGFLIVRYSVALLAWLFGFEFWIFPNFWDDSLSVSDSFKPFIQAGLDPDASSYLLYRLAVLGLLSGAGYWAYSQPDDVANMMQGQAKFMEDLYSGALMQQASEVRLPGQDQKFGSRNSWNGQDAPRVRAFDDIWADLEKEEASDEPQQQQAEGAAQADEDAAAAAGGDAQQGQAEDAAPVEDDSAAHMSDEDIMAEVAAEAAAHEKDIGRD